MRAAARRLTTLPLVLFAVVLLVFSIFETLPSAAAVDLGLGATQELVDARERALGLDASWLERALRFAFDALRGDLGQSRVHMRPVQEPILAALGPTLAYALPAFLLALFASTATALRSAEHPGSAQDRAFDIGALLMVATSSLIVVVAARDLVAHRMGLADVAWPLGHESPSFSQWWLPVLLWGALQWGADHRHLRALFVGHFRSPWALGWRARGLDDVQIRQRVLRQAAAEVLVRFAHRLPYLLVGGVVIEEVFNVPGMGRLVVDALRGDDQPLLAAIAITLSLVTVFAQAASEGLASMLDPRREETPSP